LLKILEVNNLVTTLITENKSENLIENVNFVVKEGETIGIVGESGSGKSITALSLMDLLPKNIKVTKGQVIFDNKNLLELNDNEIRNIRGKDISMIFQDNMSSLNPVFTIGNQIIEAIRVHSDISKKEAKMKALELLKKVGLSRPEKILKEYPYMLSGGMRQRAMIAMALTSNPKLLIADEPTTALDVTIQAQIVELIKRIKDEYKMAVILITHDIGLIAEMADRVIVMYAGEIVEDTDVNTLFNNPQHPYTMALLKSVPHINDKLDKKLVSIPGTVPEHYEDISSCRFMSRCEYAFDKCKIHPDIKKINDDHAVRCYASWEGKFDYEGK